MVHVWSVLGPCSVHARSMFPLIQLRELLCSCNVPPRDTAGGNASAWSAGRFELPSQGRHALAWQARQRGGGNDSWLPCLHRSCRAPLLGQCALRPSDCGAKWLELRACMTVHPILFPDAVLGVLACLAACVSLHARRAMCVGCESAATLCMGSVRCWQHHSLCAVLVFQTANGAASVHDGWRVRLICTLTPCAASCFP